MDVLHLLQAWLQVDLQSEQLESTSHIRAPWFRAQNIARIML